MLIRSLTRGTMPPDDGLRKLLSVYVAGRMHDRKYCCHCQSRSTTIHMRIWDAASIRELLNCGLDEFIFKVMVTIPAVCKIDKDPLIVRLSLFDDI